MKEVWTGTQTEKNRGGRDLWGVLLPGFLLVVCKACFLIEVRNTSPGIASPTMIWALVHQPLIKKMFYKLAYSSIFFFFSFFFFRNSYLCIFLTWESNFLFFSITYFPQLHFQCYPKSPPYPPPLLPYPLITAQSYGSVHSNEIPSFQLTNPRLCQVDIR